MGCGASIPNCDFSTFKTYRIGVATTTRGTGYEYLDDVNGLAWTSEKKKLENIACKHYKDWMNMIVEMKNLEVLWLGFPYTRSGSYVKWELRLPEHIFGVDSKLKTIGIKQPEYSKKYWTELPESLGVLKNLEKLVAIKGSNRLMSLPDSIGSCSNLKVLNIGMPCGKEGGISELPSSICSLRKLKELTVESPVLSAIPGDIGRCTELTQMRLVAPFAYLPNSIGNLENLEEIEIESSALMTIPTDIGRCTGIVRMRIDAPIAAVPSAIADLKNLELLMLRRGDFSELPDPISNLASLFRVAIVNNQKLKKVPDSTRCAKRAYEFQYDFTKDAQFGGDAGMEVKPGTTHQLFQLKGCPNATTVVDD